MSFSSSRVFIAVVYGLSLLNAVYALTFGFPYGSQKVRGVNLGGWLVLEVPLSLDSLSTMKLKIASSSPGLRHPSSTTPVTTVLSMNTPSVNIKTIRRLWPRYRTIGILG